MDHAIRPRVHELHVAANLSNGSLKLAPTRWDSENLASTV